MYYFSTVDLSREQTEVSRHRYVGDMNTHPTHPPPPLQMTSNVQPIIEKDSLTIRISTLLHQEGED